VITRGQPPEESCGKQAWSSIAGGIAWTLHHVVVVVVVVVADVVVLVVGKVVVVVPPVPVVRG
jgi:hypothetical protein